MIHYLKTWPPVFQHMVDGLKRFEYRKNDRDFKVGDTLVLREWRPDSKQYSRREKFVTVRYIMSGGQFGIPEGFCIMDVADCVPKGYEVVVKAQNSAMLEIAARGVVQAFDLNYGKEPFELTIKRLREALQLQQ